MMSDVVMGPFSWERVIRAVELVSERLRRVTEALNSDGVPYAVIGGHAVEAWVARADPSAVRVTPDVEILLRREDQPRATVALASAGFLHQCLGPKDLFLDSPDDKPRSAVKVNYSGEPPRPGSPFPAPDIAELEWTGKFCLLGLDPLARLMLSSHSLVDKVLLRDMIDVELIDQTWTDRLPPVLAARLPYLLDTPDG